MRVALVIAIVMGAACGGDDGGPPPADAPPATTQCGTVVCQAASEICVISTPVGPGMSYECRPVPAACTGDRTCGCAGATLCTGAFDTCSDGAEANTITCTCPACQ
jgi:hypothetical protein